MTTSTAIATVASKSLRRTNAIIISRKPPNCIGNLQPSAAELKKLGIKVRDFASEKTLPPARTVYFHRQILPGVARQVIRRQKTQEDVSQLQQSHWYVNKTYQMLYIMLITLNIISRAHNI